MPLKPNQLIRQQGTILYWLPLMIKHHKRSTHPTWSLIVVEVNLILRGFSEIKKNVSRKFRNWNFWISAKKNLKIRGRKKCQNFYQKKKLRGFSEKNVWKTAPRNFRKIIFFKCKIFILFYLFKLWNFFSVLITS